jgi:hypothetical protein
MPASPESLRVIAHNWPEFNELYIMLQWYPNTENDLAGYEVHRGDAIYSISLYDTTSSNFYKDTTVEVGTKYYYQVNAFDELSLKGPLTDPRDDTPLKAPNLSSPLEGEIIDTYPMVFTWEDVVGENSYRLMIGTSKVNLGDIWSTELGPDQTTAEYSGVALSARDYYWAVGTITNSVTDLNSLSEIRLFTVK